MGIIFNILFFIKVFICSLSALYVMKVAYDILKVLILQEGKVELGKNGLLYLGCAIAYVITCIIV